MELVFSPDIQCANADRLGAVLAEAAALYRPVVLLLDCSKVVSMDGTGARALLAGARDVSHECGGLLVVHSLPDAVAAVLEATADVVCGGETPQPSPYITLGVMPALLWFSLPRLMRDENPCRMDLPRVHVIDLVSKAGTGVCRANTEKQFFFLNGRPVELPRLAKALNETWRCYEMGHKPAAVLDVRLAPRAFDVNLAPDKRTVVLVAEAVIGGHRAKIFEPICKSRLSRLHKV